MAISSPEELLDALKKSRLLSTEQLTQAHDTVLLTSNAHEFAEILIEEGLLTEWQSQQLLAGSTRFHIGNYVLLDLLGRGGMGSVYLARHTTMDRRVALKVISRRVGRDPASLERFLTEARATASLDHPNIVRAYDVDQENDRFFIVMEYVSGHDLQQLVDSDGPLEFEFLVDCIRQAAEGLSHAHRRNMVHCDIKPSNLLVNTAGVVKILDMGMARLLNESDEDSSANRDERILGTVDYTAPEQAMNGPDFDHRADIYSLGCTMYFLLTGHPPFDEGTLAQRIIRHQTQTPPDILLEHPDVPPELIAICLKMMAKDPNDRYQSADEIAKALTGWQPSPEIAAPAAELAGEQKSTGVAIDEEDFKTVASSASEAAGNASAPRKLWGDERRLVFWMATGASAVGFVLIVAAILVITLRDDTGGPEEPTAPTQVVRTPNGVKEESQEDPTHAIPPRAEPPQPIETPPPPPEPITPPAAEPVDPPPVKQDPPVKETRPAAPPAQPSPIAPFAPPSGPTPVGPTGTTIGPLLDPSAALDPKPVAPPTPAPQPEPKKDVNPLRGLPGVVTLPPRSEIGKTVVFGATSVAPPVIPRLDLLGGDSALKGDSRFVLEPRPDQSDWSILLLDENEEPTDVARLSFQGMELSFAWTDGAHVAAASHLKNCLLELSIDQYVHIVRLTAPRVMPPLTLSLKTGSAQLRLPTDDAPELSATRLVITRIDGLPDHARLKKPVTLELGPGKRQDIAIGERNECKIELRAEYVPRGQAAELEVTAYWQLASRGKLSRLSARQIGWLDQHRGRLEIRAQAARAAGSRRNLSESETKRQQQTLRKIEGELDWLNRFVEWFNTSHGEVRIHFQQQIVIDKHRVIILDSRLFEGENVPSPDTPLPPAGPSPVPLPTEGPSPIPVPAPVLTPGSSLPLPELRQ